MWTAVQCTIPFEIYTQNTKNVQTQIIILDNAVRMVWDKNTNMDLKTEILIHIHTYIHT